MTEKKKSGGEKKTAIEAQRAPSGYMMPPKQIRVAKKPGEPFYDKHRVDKPVNMGLVASMRRYGVLKPIIISKVGNEVWLVDGRQRHKAAEFIVQDGGTILLPCIYKKGEEITLNGMMRAANECVLVDDMVTRALHAQELLDQSGDIQLVADTFGVGVPQVKAWGKLLELCAEVKAAVRDGKIPMTAAIKLHGLAVEEQKKALATLLSSGVKPSVSNAQRIATGKTAESRGPGRPLIRKIQAVIEDDDFDWQVPDSHKDLVAFFLGAKTIEEVAETIPWLQDAVEKAKEDKRRKQEEGVVEEAEGAAA